MLMIEPPLSLEHWINASIGDQPFQQLFSEYCDNYQASVMALPQPAIDKVIAHLVRDLETCTISPEALHVVVERELGESEFEATSKAVRLIILCALGESLRTYLRILPKTDRLLRISEDLIPPVLMIAINDHFGCCEDSVQSSHKTNHGM